MNPGAIRRLLADLGHMVNPLPIANPKFSMSDLTAARRYYDEHGWVVLKNVFSKAEIEDFRTSVLASRRDGVHGDLLSNPMLSKAITDERVARIAKALLPGQPVYFGDSGWNSANTQRIQMGFHKDNADKFDQAAPDWKSPFTIFTMAVYLQDTAKHSGGVGIRDKSHRTVDTWFGRPVPVAAEPGDVVVWYFTTSHTGYASRLRLFRNAYLPIVLQARLTVKNPNAPFPEFRPPFFFRPPADTERLGLFMAFGVDDEHLKRNIRYHKRRRYWVERLQRSHYAEEAIAKLRANGIRFLDVAAEVRNADLSAIPEEHRDIPYGDDGRADGSPPQASGAAASP